MANGNLKFINSLFLTSLIERQLGLKDVKIKEYNLEEISEKIAGASTRSVLNRLFVRYECRGGKIDVVSFVIKAKPIKGELANEFKECSDFNKEVVTYKSLLPEFEKQLKSAGINIEFTPRVISTFNIPTEGIIFEEVTDRGYHIQFEKFGLNKSQSIMALEKLATFHAASVVLLKNNSINLDKFTRGTFHNNWQNKCTYFTEAYRLLIDNADEVGIDSAITGKLKSFSEPSIKKVIEDYTSSLNNFKVINHGDYWTRNIFFKYKGNDLVDSLFVDFQNVVIGTPLIDLFYFLTTSVADQVLIDSRDELIYVYHKTLTNMLQKLNYDGYVPSLNEFQVEILKRGCLELYFAVTIAPYIKTPDPKVTIAIQPSLYKECYLTELKTHAKTILLMNKNLLQAQLKHFNATGILDITTNEGLVKSMKNLFGGKK
jgi:hypothetical protein